MVNHRTEKLMSLCELIRSESQVCKKPKKPQYVLCEKKPVCREVVVCGCDGNFKTEFTDIPIDIGTEHPVYTENTRMVHNMVKILGLIVLFILTFLIVAILYEKVTKIEDPNVYAPLPYPPPNLGNSSLIGSSVNGGAMLNNGAYFTDKTSCNSNSSSYWGVGTLGYPTCRCYAPFYGERCDLQAHSSNYTSAGIPNTTVTLTSLSTSMSSGLSFPFSQNSIGSNQGTYCTDRCDNDDNCVGVSYQSDGTCTLLNSVSISGLEGIPFNAGIQSTLYLKNQYMPLILGHVILYSGSLPLRWWNYSTYSNGENQLTKVFPSVVYKLPFVPSDIVNNSGYYGLVSSHPFTEEQFDALVQLGSGPTQIVVSPNDVSLGLSVQNDEGVSWVMFVPS